MTQDSIITNWLNQHTTQDTRYAHTKTSLCDAMTCWVYNLRDETQLIFTVIGKKIHVIMTDNTVDLVREEFDHWRDAIHFAKGILATKQHPY